MKVVKEDQEPFSPTLRMAMAEIEKVMEKYDIAGFTVLQDPTHTEFSMKVSPSYSIAYMKGKTFAVQELVEDPSNPNAHKEKLLDTLKMLRSLQQLGGKVSFTFAQAYSYIVKKYNIKLTPPTNGLQR